MTLLFDKQKTDKHEGSKITVATQTIEWELSQVNTAKVFNAASSDFFV